jgi:uridine phosphorylase
VSAEVSYAGEPVLITSTGIGGPATAIVAEELCQLGITQIVRVGTCGSMQRRVRPGHLVISSGSVRDEGTSRQYLPLEVPAVPDPMLLVGLIQAAAKTGVPFHVGVTHCKDAYYVERPFSLPLAHEWSARWVALRSMGVLATEMEAAALFAVGVVRGTQAGAVLVPTDGTISRDQALSALQTAARVAVDGARIARSPVAAVSPEPEGEVR